MEWIKTTDEFPQHDMDVLCYNEEWKGMYTPNGVRIGFVQRDFTMFLVSVFDDKTDGYITVEEQPTHWMPLPEPPKE